MNRYVYEGPVMLFDKIVCRHWVGETYATTVNKARSNLSYTWKTQNGYSKNAMVKLTGQIKQADVYDSGEQMTIKL